MAFRDKVLSLLPRRGRLRASKRGAEPLNAGSAGGRPRWTGLEGFRSFGAAEVSELLADFVGTTQAPDELLRKSLEKTRARVRQLWTDEGYARRWGTMVKTNVLGHQGIRLKPMARREDGTLDERDNALVLDTFNRWGHRSTCDAGGRLSWQATKALVSETWARDGEAVIRILGGFDNPFRFALKVLEGDHIDHTRNHDLDGGHRIKLGVEMDRWERPLAFHMRTRHPGETSYPYGGFHYERIPASEIIHLYIVERAGQSRGIPPLVAAIRDLKMGGGYKEAVLVGARVGASSMGFFKTPTGTEYIGEKQPDGSLVREAEPGAFEQIPQGTEFVEFNPSQPNQQFAPFHKAILRSVASSVSVSYNSLGADLEGVNFSSLRQGNLSERDMWQMVQAWVASELCEPVYQAWLPWAILSGELPVPMRKLEKYRKVAWQPRGFPWVDPKKELEAAEKGLVLGVMSREEICAARGLDWRAVFEQLAVEKAEAERLGIDVDPEVALAGVPAPVELEDEE